MVFKIGHLISSEKIAKTGLESIFAYLRNSNEFELKDLSYDTLDKETIPVDLLLFKANSLLVSNHEKEKLRLQKLMDYLNRFPKVIPLDALKAQSATLDRDLMGKLLLKVENDVKSHFPIHNPQHKLYSTESTPYDLSGLHFPLICKTNQAGGSDSAHHMGIVFQEKGLHEFKPPIVAQEFFNHDSVLWKVFVIGDSFSAVKKKSIPNMPQTHSKNLMFDSQKPLEEQIVNNGIELSSDLKSKFDGAQEPPTQLLEKLCASIHSHFGLYLYGFDLIQNVNTPNKEWGIFDVNYFPSYKGVTNFDEKVLSLFRKIAAAQK